MHFKHAKACETPTAFHLYYQHMKCMYWICFENIFFPTLELWKTSRVTDLEAEYVSV